MVGLGPGIQFSPPEENGHRGFSETDLRTMLEQASRLRQDRDPERWIVETTLNHRGWQVIVEPDTIDRLIVVITAFPVEP